MSDERPAKPVGQRSSKCAQHALEKPILTAHQIKEARERLAKGEKTRDLAKSYGVSISTLSRLAA
jgi:hypothetical protein